MACSAGACLDQHTTICQPQTCWKHYRIATASLGSPAASMKGDHDSCKWHICKAGPASRRGASGAKPHWGTHCKHGHNQALQPAAFWSYLCSLLPMPS